MTIKRIAQTLGLCGVAALGLLSMIASTPGPRPGGAPPVAPSNLTLAIPNDAFGHGFATLGPTTFPTATTPATYKVLPLLSTTAPVVRAYFSTPYPADLTVTVTDVTNGQTVALPQIPGGSTGSSTGFFQVANVGATNPATWTVIIRYPDSFQGSRSITTSIADVVGGQASAPLVYALTWMGKTVTVSIVTENSDGKITSNPPGIDCPGVCTFDFFGWSSVALTQSVLHNATEFLGWTGSCIGNGNPCSVQLRDAPVAVTANFRVHTSSAVPPIFSCSAPQQVTGKRWVSQPNCGTIPTSQGATLTCDAQGYFCCGVSGGNATARCSGHNETVVTCARDSLGVFAGDGELIQPGGCYVPDP